MPSITPASSDRSNSVAEMSGISGWRILATVALIVCAIYASMVRLSGDDFWLQAKIGELIVRDHAIPQTLLFPFTEVASETFNAHEWLMSIVFHAGLVALGEDGMPFLIAALGLALFIAAARLTYVRTGGSYPIALLGGYLALLAENYRHVLRPELPTLVLMAVLWNVLEAYKAKPNVRLAFLTFALMVAWVNSHGSFILGPIMVGIYTFGLYVDDLYRVRFRNFRPSPQVVHWLALLLVASVSCLVNPFGWELIHFVFSFSASSDVGKHLTEWLPTLSDQRILRLRGFWIALGVWLLMLILAILGRKKLSAVDWLFFLAFSFLAYKAIRFPVYLGLVAAYLMPVCLPLRWKEKSLEKHWLQAGTLIGAVSVIAVFNYGNASENRTFSMGDRTKFTIPMIEVLSDPALQGNVLNSMEFGAELIYRAYPRLRPSIDCRFDSYGTDYSLFNEALLKNDALLDEFVIRYDVRYLLINQNQFQMFQSLENWQKKKWRVYFMDSKAVLLQRSDVQQGSPAN